MSLSKSFLKELESEGESTRKMLSRVPEEHFTFQPHDKSFAMGHLARHIAEIPGWVELMVSHNELDFASMKYTPPVIETNADLMKCFEDNLKVAREEFLKADDSKYSDNWTMRSGEQVFFTMSKEAVIRKWVLNHIIHHRAQLGVYLRLLDIPVPGMYGPSADDTGM